MQLSQSSIPCPVKTEVNSERASNGLRGTVIMGGWVVLGNACSYPQQADYCATAAQSPCKQ